MAFWRRFRTVMRIVWPRFRCIHTLFLGFQICCSLAYAWSYNYMSNNVGSLTGAVTSGEISRFYHLSGKLIGAAVVGALANSLQLSIAEYQYKGLFRQSLCTAITKTFLSHRTYFTMLHLDRSITDPDSRICEDVHSLFEKLKLIVIGTPMYSGYLPATACVIWFTVTLIVEAGWLVAGIVFGVFLVSTVASLILMRPPARASRCVQDANSTYRSAHSYLAAHAEHVAFLKGEAVEEEKLQETLHRALPLVWRHALWLAPLNTWTILFYWAAQFYAFFIPGAVWLWTDDPRVTNYTLLVNVGTVAFALLLVLTYYLLLTAAGSELVAITARVGELLDLMEAIHRNANYRSTTSYTQSPDDGTLSIDKVTLLKPGTAQPMIKEVSLCVGPSRSVVIMGPSGVGKTSILRVLAQLWPAEGGCIATPSRFGSGGIMFVPQRPYLTLGTLEEQVAYPDPVTGSFSEAPSVDPNAPTDSTSWASERAPLIGKLQNDCADPRWSPTDSLYKECLRQVGLGYLLDRFHATECRPWNQILSVGEQQRVGIARVLFHQPRIAVMDESTSAIDEPTEELVFLALKKRRIALLSVAHRSTVRRYHDAEFLLSHDGSWVSRDIPQDRSSDAASPR